MNRGSVEDWAAKAARRIASDVTYGVYCHEQSEQHIAAIIATFADPLVTLLLESKREHSDGEANDCPMANPKYTYNIGEPCTCGADAWNARVDAALAGDVT